MNGFNHAILKELESLFPEGRIETLVRRESPTDDEINSTDYAVQVIDQETGQIGVSEDFETQIQNKAMALVRLLQSSK